MMVRKRKKPTESKVLARPYEPTELEAKAIAKVVKRRVSQAQVPSMKVTMSGPDGAKIAHTKVDHEDQATGYALLASTIAMDDDGGFLSGQLNSLANAANKHGVLDDSLLNYGISIVAGIEPKDHVETLLATQMAAVQIATMNMAARLGNATRSDTRGESETAFNRLARTFAAQVEALKRYRSKGEQRVYVERVNVERGGQAVVGNVTHGGAGRGIDEIDG